MLSRKVMSGGAPVDPYFKNVTLLLHGDGTNGGQNNTFIDGSSNNFTITRNGNTTQGSFNPYGTLWSNYFDGDGDYLTAPDNAAFQFGTGDFTVEAWINLANTVGAAFSRCEIVGNIALGSTTNWHLTVVSTSRVIEFYAENPGTVQIVSTTSINFNQWYHVAVSRTGGTLRLFLNGVQEASTADASSYKDIAYPLSIGADAVGNGEFGGYISNVRIVKGTAVYTANFTPPTANLTAIANTSLLTCQSNRFIDNSSNSFAITRNGNVAVTSFAPFAPTSVYTSGLGASGYFDGSGDYLVITNNTNLNLGTGDYTFECWVYPFGATIYKGIFGKRANNVGWTMLLSNADPAYMGFYYSGNNIATSGPVLSRAWSHLAWVKRSGTVYYYVNGKQVHSIATGPGDNTYDTTLGVSQNVGSTGEVFDGYICDARYVKGTAVYTADFTPPTSPLTAITNTQLLCNFKNAAIFDSAAKNDLETVGNAQIDTTTKKFGTGSMEFDGNGDYLRGPKDSINDFNTGDFTVEFWLYATAVPGAGGFVSLFDTWDATGSQTNRFSINLSPASKIYLYSSSTLLTSTNAISLNTWAHVAAVRSGTTAAIYLDGIGNGTATVTNNYTSSMLTIAANGQGNGPLTGFIDDLRITKGVARYTANFTPPTLPFPNK